MHMSGPATAMSWELARCKELDPVLELGYCLVSCLLEGLRFCSAVHLMDWKLSCYYDYYRGVCPNPATPLMGATQSAPAQPYPTFIAASRGLKAR
jgi:hypothetical protein